MPSVAGCVLSGSEGQMLKDIDALFVILAFAQDPGIHRAEKRRSVNEEERSSNNRLL